MRKLVKKRVDDLKRKLKTDIDPRHKKHINSTIKQLEWLIAEDKRNTKLKNKD